MNYRNREIGSEYWCLPLCEKENNLFTNVEWFLSGRDALSYILCDIKKERCVKTAALPVWCCDSMIIPFANAGVEVIFYENEIPKSDVILTMEYFGYIRNHEIDFDGIVICDVTHSMFSPNMGIKKCDYFFGSLRKWAGFKTGGFAGKTNGAFSAELPKESRGEYTALRCRAMEEKAEYIGGKREDKGYLSLFAMAEEMLEEGGIHGAYPEDVLAAKKLDVEFIKNTRRENAKTLLEEVRDIALFKEVKEDDVPLFVPIMLDERDALRKHLIENSVFCPIHWPHTKWHGEKTEVYNKELSLVCDQRYTKEDMEYICKLIREFRRRG